MYFSITTTFTALVLLAAATTTSVTAQTPPLSDACTVCLAHAIIKFCDVETLESALTLPTVGPVTLTPKQRACFCPLVASTAWMQPCVTPSGVCTAVEVQALWEDSSDVEIKAACGGPAGIGAGPGAMSASAPRRLGSAVVRSTSESVLEVFSALFGIAIDELKSAIKSASAPGLLGAAGSGKVFAGIAVAVASAATLLL